MEYDIRVSDGFKRTFSPKLQPMDFQSIVVELCLPVNPKTQVKILSLGDKVLRGDKLSRAI